MSAAILFSGRDGAANAQTTYPLNRAENLTGTHFDLKVEFPGVPPPAAIHVTINGAEAASATGKAASVIERKRRRRLFGVLDSRRGAGETGQIRRRGDCKR